MRITSLCTSYGPSFFINKDISLDLKISCIASFLIASFSVAFISALYIHNPSTSWVHLAVLGGTTLVSGSIFIISLLRIAAKKQSACQGQTPLISSKEEIFNNKAYEETQIECSKNTQETQIEYSNRIEGGDSSALPSKNAHNSHPAEKLVHWIFTIEETVESSAKTINDPSTINVLEWITSTHPWLLDTKEFSCWKEYKKPQQEKTLASAEPSPFLDEVQTSLVNLLKEHWDICKEGYPENHIEMAIDCLIKLPLEEDHSAFTLINNRFLWFTLLPFWLRFYEALGEKRKELLPWIEKNREAFVRLGLSFLKEQENIVAPDTGVFMLQLGLNLLTPFNRFLSPSDFEGKKFITDFIHGVIFNMGPAFQKTSPEDFKTYEKKIEENQKYLKRLESIRTHIEKSSCSGSQKLLEALKKLKIRWGEEEEKKYKASFFVDRCFYAIVMPYLSYDQEGKRIGLREYLDNINQASQDFNPFETFSDINQYLLTHKKPFALKNLSFKELPLVATPVNEVCSEMETAISAMIKESLPNFITNEKVKKKWSAFSDDLNKMGKAFYDFCHTTFYPSVKSIGELGTKSVLISKALPTIYEDPALMQNLMSDFFRFLITPMEAFGLDVSYIKQLSEEEIKKHVANLTSALNKKKNKEEKEEDKIAESFFVFFPLQDYLLGGGLSLLFVFHSAHLLRPFLKKHLSLLIVFMKQWNIPDLSKYIKWINRGISIFLALLKPINGVLLGKWPLKSAFIKKAVKILFEIIAKGANEDVKDKKQIEESNKIFNSLICPIITFFLMGIFGNDKKQKKIFDSFEESLRVLYKSLYDFDRDEAIAKPEDFSENLKKKIINFFQSDKKDSSLKILADT